VFTDEAAVMNVWRSPSLHERGNRITENQDPGRGRDRRGMQSQQLSAGKVPGRTDNRHRSVSRRVYFPVI
jgi:hypothetical protein